MEEKMLHIYLDKTEDVIKSSDAFFNLYTQHILTDKEKGKELREFVFFR